MSVNLVSYTIMCHNQVPKTNVIWSFGYHYFSQKPKGLRKVALIFSDTISFGILANYFFLLRQTFGGNQ